MARFGLCGPAYTSQSKNADVQSCINLYLEQIESGSGNAPLVLYPTPGSKTFVNLGRTITPATNGIGAFDQHGDGNGNGTAVATASKTPTGTELAIFLEANSLSAGSFAPAAGWNAFGVGSGAFAQLVSAPISGTGTITGAGGDWCATVALFKFFGGSIPSLPNEVGIGGSLGSPHSLPFSFNVTKGNTIVAFTEIGFNAGIPTGIAPTDTQSNPYTLLAHVAGATTEISLWTATVSATGPLTININGSTGPSTSSQFSAIEVPTGAAAVVNSGPVRDEIFINGRAFVICGEDFDEIFANGTFTTWGQVANDSLIATSAATPQQILIASAGTAYVFDLIANTLTVIPGATFPGPVSQAAVCDGFFLLTIQNTKEFFVSGPLDATDWVTNGSAIVSVFADNIVSMLVHDREIHFWSDRERTVYYDSGNIFPFDVIPGTTIQAGSAAKSSPARLDDRVLWLNADDNGTATVKMGIGYTPQRISTHALEFAMQSYARIDDVVGYTYQDQGHSFYVLYFPTPSKTWVYDATISQMIGVQCWHERQFYLASTGGSQAHKSQCHMFAFGKHLVGDWSSGKVFQLEIPTQNGAIWTFADDDGNLIRRVRAAAHISQQQKRLFVNELRVYAETGLGPIPALSQPAPFPTTVVLPDLSVPTNSWLLTIADDGTPTFTSTTQPSQAIFLNFNGQSYQAFVSGGGTHFSAQAVTFNPSYPATFPMATIPSFLQTGLEVT